MTRDETIALWEKCEEARAAALAEGKSDDKAHDAAKEIWNDWANGVRGEYDALTSKGKFKTKKAIYGPDEWISAETIGTNEETLGWLDRARVDFHGFSFKTRPHFRDFLFPGQSIFGESKQFTKERLQRPSVKFINGANFDGAIFFFDAVFDWAKFYRSVGFNSTQFHGIARFDQCIFLGTSWFHRTIFEDDVWFGQVQFLGYTDFYFSQFKSNASFFGVKSEGAFALNGSYFEALSALSMGIDGSSSS